ncbi:unnamed protein product [Peronospora belbahrii]|uniref:Uncharacterized protein n=1 Tax=Peronospora belbahrii TaxID=622444 RepID=A0ABN8D8U1_9STRA|nr:unnamed protein product [Peronospora belbahrii]
MYLSFYQLQTEENGDDSSSDSPNEEDNFLFFINLAKTTKNMTDTTFGRPTQVELHLATAALRTMGKVIYYGDQHLIIDVADSNRLQSKVNRVITHLSKQQESAHVQGGFLRCDGRGKTILFEMHGQEFRQSNRLILQTWQRATLAVATLILTKGAMMRLNYVVVPTLVC